MQSFLVLHQWQDFGLLLLRLVIVSIFLVHGTGKWGMWSAKPSKMMPGTMINLMRFLSVAEPLGAVAVLLGFLTQAAAVGLGLVMIGAMYLKITTWKTPFSAHDKTGWEFDLMIFSGLVVLFFSGAGQYALDRMWFGI